MKYSLKNLLSSTNSMDYDLLFFCKEIDSKYLLEIANKKYLINYDYDVMDFSEQGVVCINLSDRIAFVSIIDGGLVFYSGLRESLIGVEALENDFLVVSDMSLFFVNKKYFFPWGYKTFPDSLVTYKLLNNLEIDLEYATDGKKILKLI